MLRLLWASFLRLLVSGYLCVNACAGNEGFEAVSETFTFSYSTEALAVSVSEVIMFCCS